jgi:glycosyltransferase involved in cell wall biosynthesis
MRILEIETFGRGGLVHYAYNLSTALADRGHDVTLVTAASYELAGVATPSRMRVLTPIARLSARSRAFAASPLRKLEALADAAGVARLVRRLDPDVVHLHCTGRIAHRYVTLLSRLGVPLAVTAHVVTTHERTALDDVLFRQVYRRSALVIAHSEFDRARLLAEHGLEASRVAVIPHGEYGFFARGGDWPDRVTARRDLGLAEDDEVALFFGYIREYKGLDVLLEAWPAVAGARSRARLVIAGDPVKLPASRREQLRAWAQRLGVLHRFGYIPFDEVGRYLASADVVVMPYRHISQSGVLFLALSLGLPVVATRVGGLPEVLSDGESGLLVSPESPGELADALTRVLGDRDLRARLSDGARRVARAHSWDAIAVLTESAFRERLPPRAAAVIGT